MNALVLVTVMLALYALSVFILGRFALRGLGLTRTFSKPAVFEGDEGEMIEIVRNDRPFIIPWLRVESGISPHIRLGRQENLNVSDHSRYCSLFTLMPYQQVRRTHHVRFLRRGEYDLGSASLTAGDLFGLFEKHREQHMRVPVLVYPRLLDENELPAAPMQLMHETVVKHSLLADPFLIRGIRPYQFGDPVRDIHWAASARMGEIHVRLHDASAQSRMLVVLNGQIRSDQWGDRLNEADQERIEYGISLAATLCLRALEEGCLSGFAANMPISSSDASAMISPANDAAARERLLSAFARLKLVRTLRFPTFLQNLSDLRDTCIIILSCYDSEEIQTCMQSLRSGGNQVSLYLMEGGGI